MSLLAIFLTAWAVGFSGALAPGPISTLVITEATRRGFWAGPLLTVGHAIAEIGMVLALVAGLRDYLANSRLALAIALIGGLFLVWMGASTLRDALRQRLQTVAALDPKPEQPRWGPARAGLLASISNPFWFLWWGTVGASYIVVSLRCGPSGLAAFYCGHTLADLSWNSVLALLSKVA